MCEKAQVNTEEVAKLPVDTGAKGGTLYPYRPKKLAVGEVDIMEAIPDDFMKTVVFLCIDEVIDGSTKRVPKATGFFVRVPIEKSLDLSVDYVVTARHCIDEARPYGQIYVRANRKIGEFIEFPTRVEDWYSHDNADVAIIPIHRNALPPNIAPTDLDIKGLKISDFVGGGPDYKLVGDTQFGRQEIQPRVGHQVYCLGLFTEHYGKERNLPIARFGHISRMPGKLEIEMHSTHFSIVAYLVEFYSWGGHSGSPVFFLYPTMLQKVITLISNEGKPTDITFAENLGWTSGFMGLVSGHYDIERETQKTGDILGKIQIGLNSGVAIVTPAEAVTQLLMRGDLVRHRKELKKIAESKTPMPTLDAAEPEPFTQHDHQA